MKTTNQLASQPYANICINKSRLKIYHKESNPTYYLEDQQEFSIELRNPTQNVVLAKIIINGKAISQGGIVLREGETTFIERYLDIAKKFKFETYEISNSEEVKKAIENNGNIKVEFYSEYIPINYGSTITLQNPWINQNPWYINCGNSIGGYAHNTGTPLNGTLTYTSGANVGNSVNYNQNISNNLADSGIVNCNYSNPLNNDGYQDFFIPTREEKSKPRNITASLGIKKNKIETGKVEMGSDSNQTFKYVDKQFNLLPFHTIEYKLLPISQKVNTTEDISIRRYCTLCGTKATKGDNFCSKCGNKH